MDNPSEKNHSAEQAFNKAMQKTLNKSLDHLDAKTLADLAHIREKSLAESNKVSSAENSSQKGFRNVIPLNISNWKDKQVAGYRWGFALAACLALTIVTPIFLQQSNPHRESADELMLYADIDPDLLIDMEIAEAWGDES